MDAKLIERINELAALQKSRGLTEDERIERERLRAEYLHAFRGSVRQTLDGAKVEYPDGSRKTLTEHLKDAKKCK